MEIIDHAALKAKSCRMDALTSKKVDQLRLQKRLTDTFNELLTKDSIDGLNENSRQCCRNLRVAIAVSSQPGYHEYHVASAEVQKIEKSGTLTQLTSKIRQCEKEIEQINNEMGELLSKNGGSDEPLPMSGIDQWFRQYGIPKGYDISSRGYKNKKHAPPKGWYSEYMPYAKIYGSSSHHPAFKSQVIKLKKGRITR